MTVTSFSQICTGCGGRALCCFEARNTLEYFKKKKREGVKIPKAATVFPYHVHAKTGRCSKLTPEGRCSVYATRPLICNVDGMAKALGIPLQKMWEANGGACNQAMLRAGIPAEHWVQVPEPDLSYQGIPIWFDDQLPAPGLSGNHAEVLIVDDVLAAEESSGCEIQLEEIQEDVPHETSVD